MDAGQACGCSNANPFNQHVDDLNSFVGGDSERIQRTLRDVGKRFPALLTAIPLQSLRIKPEFECLNLAAMTCHFGLAFLDGLGYRDSES